MNSQAAALKITPVVQSSGFTLVEEDDVAFSLTVCREIYRIYGTYQDGELAATQAVRSGLLLTMQMFATLQNTVTEGMPALRIEVAAAQTREMMGALFGHGLPSKRMGTASQDRSRVRGRQAGPSLASHNGKGTAIRTASESVYGQHREAAELDQPAARSIPPAPSPPATSHQPAAPHQPAALGPVAAAERVYLRDRWYAFWGRQTLTVRVAATLLGCCFVAVLIDVPFTIVAVFPNLLIPLTVAFLVADVVRLLYRMKRPRQQFWSRASERRAARSASIVTSLGFPNAHPNPSAPPSTTDGMAGPRSLTAGVPAPASASDGSAGRESEFPAGLAKPVAPTGELVVGRSTWPSMRGWQ